jgi:ABC-type transport system involved in multi-copper enzyme maturation permease subunit
MAAVAALMCLGVITLSLSIGRNPTQIGQDFYWTFSATAFAFSLLAGPVFTADCLSEEKRAGTLVLLFLTDLKGYDVLLGKLVAASLLPFYALLAAIPVLALPFFLGGVTPGEFWRMTAVLLTSLLVSLSVGAFVSAVSRNGRRAFVATVAFVFVLALAPLAVAPLVVPADSALGTALASVSCLGQTFIGVTEASYAARPVVFWNTLLSMHALSLLLLALASVLLPRCWQEGGAHAAGRLRMFPRLLRRPRDTFRARLRRKLDCHPTLWLAERTSLNPWATHFFWALCLAMWLTGFTALRSRALAPSAVFAAVYLLHAAAKCWVTWEASRRFAEDRQSGALELLLTTPLSERAVIAGWLIGLKRRFLGPILLLFALDVQLWWASDNSEWLLGMVAAIGLFIADSYTICWVGLWTGLNAANSTRAFLVTVARVLILPWFAFLGVLGIWGSLAQGSGFPPAFGWVC